MKSKLLKILGMMLIIVLLTPVIIIFALLINHTNQLREEAKEYLPPGKIVEVTDKKLHVFAKGKGDITLVFMAGHGTSNPTLDFKPLWMRLIDDYRIAVIEKSGYGWSDTSNSPRDIDTMLEETRMALELAEEKPPYVLFPHSMSGLEAIYWAQKYPDEVEAIIGLDPCTPETIDLIPDPQKLQLNFMFIISRIGLSRFMPESDLVKNLPLMKSNDLSQKEKEQYLAVFYKSAFTKDMLREIVDLKDNAKTVAIKEIPVNIPMYFFISDGQEASVAGWKTASSNYLSKITTGKYMQLATGHYIHYEKADIVALEAKAFLNEVR